MSRPQKSAAKIARPKSRPVPPAPVVHLASGPVTPADAASKAREMRAAFESVFTPTDIMHMATTLKGKAKNGDLQAQRMVYDYFGITAPAVEPEDYPQGNVVQVNIETDDRPRNVRLSSVKPSGS